MLELGLEEEVGIQEMREHRDAEREEFLKGQYKQRQHATWGKCTRQ